MKQDLYGKRVLIAWGIDLYIVLVACYTTLLYHGLLSKPVIAVTGLCHCAVAVLLCWAQLSIQRRGRVSLRQGWKECPPLFLADIVGYMLGAAAIIWLILLPNTP